MKSNYSIILIYYNSFSFQGTLTKLENKKEKNFLKFSKLSKISIDEVLEIGEDLRYNLILSQKHFEEIDKVFFLRIINKIFFSCRY